MRETKTIRDATTERSSSQRSQGRCPFQRIQATHFLLNVDNLPGANTTYLLNVVKGVYLALIFATTPHSFFSSHISIRPMGGRSVR